ALVTLLLWRAPYGRIHRPLHPPVSGSGRRSLSPGPARGRALQPTPHCRTRGIGTPRAYTRPDGRWSFEADGGSGRRGDEGDRAQPQAAAGARPRLRRLRRRAGPPRPLPPPRPPPRRPRGDGPPPPRPRPR